MKYQHVITVHLPEGRKSFAAYEDQNQINLTDDVIESETHEDGSCVLVFSTADAMLRLRLEQEIPGCTVFPHHFSNRPLHQKHVDLLAHHDVAHGDTMEDALHKMTESHGHYRFHPHTFG